MFDASIIICTHNPREKYLERTLCGLRVQNLSTDKWELILVDNASPRPLAGKWDLSWHPHSRVVVEPQLGLASARQRGISESSGRLLIFVDDDNVLAPNYLLEALRIERDCRFLGAWGSGAITPEFEIEPGVHLQSPPRIRWLGIRRVERPLWGNVIGCGEATPIGAGLCIRRHIGEMYLEFSRTSTIHISDRKGDSLGGHGDIEICYLACKTGLGMGLFPELELLHLIPKERASEAYFLKLVEDTYLSGTLLDHKWNGTVPRSPFSLHSVASIVKNALMLRGFERRIHFAALRGANAARNIIVLSPGQ